METGYLLINKPSGPTSHDVVDSVRRITGERRIGHSGTLDPFAGGLLLVGVGPEATRNLGKFVGLDKRYRVAARLGAVSETYDRTGVMSNVKCQMSNNEGQIREIAQSFIGRQLQMPPPYSAKKIQGRKAYELARRGEVVALKPQEVEIYDIKIFGKLGNWEIGKLVEMYIHCSSGTYIRSLAHDIGQKLGTGAYAEELTRTMIGNFELSEAIPLDSLTIENWREHLITFRTVMAAGTFEILHEGHTRYLCEAKKMGERLVVVVARQARAEALRGRTLRASEEERLARVRSLQFVDAALLGDEHDPYESVKKIKPDIIALGYDQRSFVRELPEKIKAFGLSTKIARIPAHEAGKFKSSLL